MNGDAISPGLLRVMTIAAGATVANLYYNQPLLVEMGRTFHASDRALGTVPTLTQVGYALGLLLVVPLGDTLERRRVILLMTAAVGLALVGVALAPSLFWLGAASLLVGITTIVPQLLIPFAASLAHPEERGRVVGQVMSGLLIGILLSRTVSGLVGAHLGWRAMFWVAAALMAVMGVALRFVLPRQSPTAALSYPELLRSLWTLIREERVLRLHATLGALTFGSFSAFWTTLTLYLSSPVHHLGAQAAGLFGIVGVAGAVAAPLVGHQSDRRGDRRINAFAIGLVLLSFPVLWLTGRWLWGLAAGVILLDLGAQGNHIANQAKIFALRPEARSRINTLYMVSYFAGGSLGGLAATWAWSLWGWAGTCAVGGLMGGAALARLLLSHAPQVRPGAPA